MWNLKIENAESIMYKENDKWKMENWYLKNEKWKWKLEDEERTIKNAEWKWKPENKN